jgi:hypothetical protein
VVSVEAAVTRELERMGDEWPESVLGASALSLAALMDDNENSATSRSMVAKELRETMAQLRALAPQKEANPVDDLRERRNRRRRASAS